jgi:hypothetical protein
VDSNSYRYQNKGAFLPGYVRALPRVLVREVRLVGAELRCSQGKVAWESGFVNMNILHGYHSNERRGGARRGGGEAGFQHSSSLGYQRPDDALKGVATKSKAYRRTLVQPGRAASGRRSQNGILESEIFTAATGRQSYRMETVRATVTAGV